MERIFSFSGKDLLDARDGNFLKHDERVKELEEPSLLYAYANTVVFEVKSSQYAKNGIKYKVFVLLEDFYTIGKDKDIDFKDAVNYALDYGDVHVRCSCPAQLYWGYSYISTEMRYLYGVPRESRFPVERNPGLKGTICKHCDVVLRWMLSHKDIVQKLFAVYYNRLNEGDSIMAVNTDGKSIEIGRKDEEGDVFFEQQTEEVPEEETVEEEEVVDEDDPLNAFDDEDFMIEEDNVSEE